MYRIELSLGEETAFRTIEELAVAIRRGVVTSKARIWHNASNKWLPIQYHPHYKTAATMPLTKADLVVGPPVTPLSSLSVPDPNAPTSRVTPFTPVSPMAQAEDTAQPSRVTPFRPASIQPGPVQDEPRVTPFKPASPYHPAEPRVHATPSADLPFLEPLGSMSAPEPIKAQPVKPLLAKPLPAKPLVAKAQPAMKVSAAREEPPRKKKRSRARRPSKRALRVAFVGALLIGGVHVLASANGTLGPDGFRAHRRFIAAPPEAIKRDSPRTVAAVIPVLRNSSVPGAAARRPEPTPPVPTSIRPTPTPGSVPLPSAPVSDSAEIQAAPAIEATPLPSATDSLTTGVVDSSGKTLLKGILRAVSGSPGHERKPSKR